MFLKRILLLFVVFVLICFESTGQVFSVALAITPTYKTCNNEISKFSYVATITPPSGYVYGTDYTFVTAQTNFKLRTTASGPLGTVLATNSGGTIVGNTISGEFSTSSQVVDIYSIYASVTIYNMRTLRNVVVQTNSMRAMGYGADWLSQYEMVSSPNIFSTIRNSNASGATYSKAYSSNNLFANSDGWIEIGAQFGTNYPCSMFCKIGKMTELASSPSTDDNYIEFRKTGAASGAVYVKYDYALYALTGVSYNDRIFIKRTTGNTIKFYSAATGNIISSAPVITYSGDWNFGIYANKLNTGALNCISSFLCVNNRQFYNLKEDVESSVALVQGDRLRFKFKENYFDNNSNLTYTIKCLDDDSNITPITVSKPLTTNWIEIPIGTSGLNLVTNKYYLLEVKNAKGKSEYLKFKKI